MKNIQETIKSTSGTLFLSCSLKEEQSISFITSAAEHTGRRLFRREDCQTLDPAVLASTSDKKMIFAAPFMMDFLDRYLEACPAGQQHLLIHAHEAHEAIRSMSFLFHDFWEERHVNIEDCCIETAPQKFDLSRQGDG